MNEITPPTPLQRGRRPEVARRRIASFAKRFGQAHLYLAYHAAFPLALTPDLLYRLWANFPHDIHGEQLNIPWIAVADLILSSLCDEVSRELYEMNVAMRNELLKELKADTRLGEQRINELSDFLLIYIKQELYSSDPDIRDFANAQRWTALAYTEPKLAASDLALALCSSWEQNDRTEQLRMASLIETFAEPLEGFAPLLAYARDIAHFVHGDMEGAQARNIVAEVEQIERMLGVSLPIPEQIQEASDESIVPSSDLSDIAAPLLQIPSAAISPISTDPQAVPQPDETIKQVHSRFSPYVKCVCPSCFEEINLGECRIVSGVTPGKVLKDQPKGMFARMNVEPLYSAAYTMELAHRECTQCGYLLPSNIELVPSITLAVVGDVYAGKSHYIAALLHQIEADWIGHATGYARFTCLTPDVEKRYTQDYFEPLFINKQTLPPTQPAHKTTAEPLIYNLVVSPSPKHPPTTVNLIIYDASGEDFERQDRVVQVTRFVFNASAFIFVADPTSMAPVLEQLPHYLQIGLQQQFKLAQRRRAAERLNAIIDVLQRYRGDPDKSRLPDIPVAVMVSKADLFQYLSFSRRYTFMTNPHYGSGVDLQDINTVDQEVRELLRIYKQGDLLAATNRFKRVKFFATSATGEPPDVNGRFKNVEPCRCLDPMLWILYQFGIIKASVL